MLSQLQEYGLTLEEAEAVLKKYPLEVVDLALSRSPFKSKACLRQSLYLVLKYYQ
jgi:hypothetical protein